MTRSRIITAAVLASGLFAANFSATAAPHTAEGAMRAVHVSGSHQPAPHAVRTGHEQRDDIFFGGLMRRLDLTPEQREQAREILRQDADERQARLKELREVQRELQRGSFGPGFDPARIGELAQRQGTLMAELQTMRAERMNAIYSQVLTDEQRAKLDEWREHARAQMPEQHYKHGHHRWHRHGGDRPERC
jgi:Spy/CpxP family protein refolding chaperone